MIDQRDCTCGEPGLSCPKQVCTPKGPVCLDGGTDQGAPAEGGAGDVRLDAVTADASCDVGCTPSTTSTFCQSNEVQWMCQGPSWNDALFRASCRDPATNLPRFCCPPSFLSQCR
jgi:hypothetical protein